MSINWTNPNLKLRQSNGLEAKPTGMTGPNGEHIVLLEVDGGGYDAQLYKDDGLPLNPDKPRIEQVIARPDERPMRQVIDVTGWWRGRDIPLKNGTTARFERVNHMKAVAGRGIAFQIVGSVPLFLWFRSPRFWNDDGTASGRGSGINTNHPSISWRSVES